MAYDVVIRNGRVVDGSGFGSYRAEVGWYLAQKRTL